MGGGERFFPTEYLGPYLAGRGLFRSIGGEKGLP